MRQLITCRRRPPRARFLRNREPLLSLPRDQQPHSLPRSRDVVDEYRKTSCIGVPHEMPTRIPTGETPLARCATRSDGAGARDHKKRALRSAPATASHLCRSICLSLVVLAPSLALADTGIRFEDVSQKAGISYRSPTAASAWGDFNNDGWPDLWVSNHDFEPPSLFLNQKDGTFVDVASTILKGRPRGDFHGAAWADFDNDGDQDLIVLTGGAGGRVANPNDLFVNERGQLTDKAKELGADYPLGRGRTPLWVDVNRDGKLDLVLMNRLGGNSSSAVLVQTAGGFADDTRALRFRQAPQSFAERTFGRLKRLMRFRYPSKPGTLSVADEFAELADIAGDPYPELIAYMQPTRLYAIDPGGLREITGNLDLPRLNSVQDVAVDDFNGDGQMDLYLVRAFEPRGDVVQTSAQRLQGRMHSSPGSPKAIRFRTNGKITFQIYPPWLDPADPRRKTKPKLFIGSKQLELNQPTITVAPNDPAVSQPAPSVGGSDGAIFIRFDPKSDAWTLKSTVHLISFIISSSRAIDSLQTQGFKPGKGALRNALLIRKGDGFVEQSTGLTNQYTTCFSAAAGDFDNDMDIDLYLVCSGATENYPNILLENDGKGRFVEVPNAGGAAGTREGHGDQVAVADYDRDGFLDLFVTNGAGPPPFGNGPQQLFHNLGNSNHWLEIDLHGVRSNRDGIGAKVVLETNGKRQVRLQDGGMHSFSQNYMRIHFGMGPYAIADRLTVFWPSGIVQHLKNVKANQILEITEPVPGR